MEGSIATKCQMPMGRLILWESLLKMKKNVKQRDLNLKK
jgi:hypothetical protein